MREIGDHYKGTVCSHALCRLTQPQAQEALIAERDKQIRALAQKYNITSNRWSGSPDNTPLSQQVVTELLANMEQTVNSMKAAITAIKSEFSQKSSHITKEIDQFTQERHQWQERVNHNKQMIVCITDRECLAVNALVGKKCWEGRDDSTWYSTKASISRQDRCCRREPQGSCMYNMLCDHDLTLIIARSSCPA